MESPTFPTLDPQFEEYLTRRLQEYADAAADISSPPVMSPTSPTSSIPDDTDSGIHGNTWSDAGVDSPGSMTPSMLSTASCPVSPAPQRARLGYRPQRPTYDPTRGILKSITEGNTRRLSKLLGRRGPSHAASQEDLSAPLIQAIRMGQDKCVLSLLGAGADPNGTDDEGKTPLYLVMETAGGNPEILRALLKAKANPDQATWNLQHTPLHLAAKKGYQVGVKQLLAAGARPDKKDAAGNTPLMMAAKEGHINIIRALLRGGASAKNRNLTNESVLHFAAKGGSYEATNELLQAGADPNERDMRGQTPLLLACRFKHTKLAELLMDYDCDVNGQDTNSGKTALHWAIQNALTNIVTELLDAGADPNIKDKNWTTPFLLALSAGTGSRDVLELLLHSGCDVTVTDRSFNTAIHLAASEGQSDLLPALIDAGIMVDVKGPGGVTSLMLAVYGGHLSTVKVLLQYGAGVNLMDRHRASALTYAILSKANEDVVFEIIKMLIRSSCQLDNCANLKNITRQLTMELPEGVTAEERLYSPIEVAYLLGKTAIFMMLLKAGASAKSFSGGPAEMILSPKQYSDNSNDHRNQWYLVHCLRKEQQQIKSLVELSRRPALEFLNMQFKGHSYTMPQKIARLPFTDRVKAFLNYDDLDEVQSKYNVTLRDKSPQKKVSSGTSRIPSRDSNTDRNKLNRPQGSMTNLRTSFRRSNTGLNRNSAVRQSLPVGYNSQRSTPLATSTPRGNLDKTPTTRHTVSLGDSGSNSINRPKRTGLNLQSSNSRLSISRDEPKGSNANISNNIPTRNTPGNIPRVRPSSASTYASSGINRPMHQKTVSSNNLELSSLQSPRSTSSTSSYTNQYGSLNRPSSSGRRMSGRESEYERLEQAYDELRNSMIAAGSISDVSSSSSSLYSDAAAAAARQQKRRGRYSQLDPSQMLLMSPPASTVSDMSEGSVFFNNGDLSPRSAASSDDSSNNSVPNQQQQSQQQPSQKPAIRSVTSPISINPKPSGIAIVEPMGQKQRSIIRSPDDVTKSPTGALMDNNNYIKPTPPPIPPKPIIFKKQEVNDKDKDEWGLKLLRAPKIAPNMGPKPQPKVAPEMDEREKEVLDHIIKTEIENNMKKSSAQLDPEDRPLKPMSEETKKTIYDKRWARVPNPALSSDTVDQAGVRSPRSRSASESDYNSIAGKRFGFSTQKEPTPQEQQQTIVPRSSLRNGNNCVSPNGQERKEVRFSPSSEKIDDTRNGKRREKNGNLNESDDDLLHLKRWGTMTLDDPEVLDNSENFTSSKSLLTPTGKRGAVSSRSIRGMDESNVLNNNRPITSTKSMLSPRGGVTSPTQQMADSVSKVRSWSTSPSYSSGNRNTNGNVSNRNYQQQSEQNYRNRNGYGATSPTRDVVQTPPGGGGFNRGSSQYSSVRLRGMYGNRPQSAPATRDNTASLERASRKRVGVRNSRQENDPDDLCESPLTSPAEKKEHRFAPTRNDRIIEQETAESPARNDSSGSRIKMAFLRSRSFRN